MQSSTIAELRSSRKAMLTGMIGNIFEHYDGALFGLLAPLLAPLFFPDDPTTALIKTYAILPLGIIAKPLGAICFGKIGDFWGRKRSLSMSLSGMAISTCLIGFLPTYNSIGYLAPLLLAFLRFFQSFFAAGEVVGGAIFVLEQSKQKEKSFLSSLYDCTNILGILLASVIVTLGYHFEVLETGWRYLFLLGSICGCVGIYLRRSMEEEPSDERPDAKNVLQVLFKYPKELLAIIAVSGLSYTIYSMSTTFMNGFLPLISSISKKEAVGINSYLLLLDLMLLPVAGYISSKYGKEYIMSRSAICLGLVAIPGFALLSTGSLIISSIVRTVFVILGILFAAPFYSWSIEQVPAKSRFLIVALGYALGSQIIGSPSASLSLWLYKVTNVIYAPGFYLLGTTIFAFVAIKAMQRRSVPSKFQAVDA